MPGPNTGSNRFGPSSYVVGPELGNGVNFIDIQTAINQAVADGFDSTNPCTILVRPGIYTSFTMAPGITVEGVTAGSVFSNSAAVIGNVTIDSTTAGGVTYALKNMQISDPADALIFQGVGPAIIVDIANCSINGTRAVVIGNLSGTLSQIAFRECRMIGSTTGVDLQLHNSVFFFNTQVQGGTGVLMSGDARLRCFNTLIEGTVDYGVNITGTVNRLRLEFSNVTATLEAVLGVNGGEVVNIEHCTVESNAPSGFFIDNVSIFEMYDIALTGSALGNNSIATNFIDWKPHAGTAANATLPGGVRGTSCFDSSQFTVTDGFVQATGALASTYPVDNGGPGVPSAGAMSFLGSTSVDFPNPSGIETHVGATTNQIYFEDRRWITSFVVDPSATVGLRGTYTTIQAAITAAGAGPADIYIRPGTYTENLAFTGNVYLIATDMSGTLSPPVGNSAHVNIIGDHTVDGNGLTVCQGIFFGSTVTAFTLEDVSTAGVAKLECLNCFFDGTGVGFRLGGATGNGQLRLVNCQVQSVGRCIEVPTGSVGGFYELIDSTLISSGDGCVYVDSPNADGDVLECTLAGSGASPFTFDLNSAGAILELRNSYLVAPAVACITFQAAAQVFAYHNTYDPGGNAEYITGPGQYSYCDDVIIGGKLSSGIDVAATQSIAGWRPWAESDTVGTTVVRGTSAFNSAQFSVVEGFVSLSGGSSPPFTDVSGVVSALVGNGYYATAATTFTLDAAAVQGDLVIIYADTAAAVVVTANAGQQIRVGNQISAVAGTATSSAIGDSLTLRFRAATSVWETVSSMGNWTIV